MKKALISIIFLFLLTTNVKAMSITPTGPTQGTVGSTIEINITLNRDVSEKQVSAIDGILSYDSKVLTLQSQSDLLSDWTKLSPVSNGKTFCYANLSFSNLINTTSTNVVKLVFEITKNAGTTKIEITNPSITDDVGNQSTISGGSLTININSVVSDVNTLSSLKIDGTNVDNFDSNTTTYNKTVSSTKTSVNIEATKTDSNSTITGDVGTKTLNYGINTFNIIVTSESGVAKTYTLNITREEASSVNTLKTLSISSGAFGFISSITTYNVTVGSNVSKITITSTLTDSKSTYVSGYGNREVNLTTGLNQVLIKVQAENGNIRTYTLNITREAPKSSINTLKSLSLSSGTINFNSNTTTYNVTVNNSVSKITITSTLTDSKSTYVSGYGNREVNLTTGLNQVLIKVQAENGSINTYTLNITRESAKSSVNTLKTLSLSSGTINFNSNTTTYNVTVGSNVSKITITSSLTDSKSKYVSGYGNREVSLTTGLNQVLIKVQAENGSINTYTLNITRESAKSSVNTLKTLSLSSGTINFNSNTTTYNVTVNNSVSKITITSSLTDSKSKYINGYGNREVSLTTGVNQVLIKVQAENGSIKTYTLNITRESAKSSINTLKTLSLSSGTIKFNSNTTTYNVIVNNSVSKITITSSLTDSKSKYVNGYGNREVSLTTGLNQVLIKVQAENGSIKTYTLNITREDNRSKINTLKSLSLSSGTINFNSNTTTYNVTVKDEIEKIAITSSLTDSKSKYVSGYGNREVTLNKGLNKVLIKVQAENGSINTYTLNITRGEVITEKGLIKDITVKNYEINFKNDIYSYDIKIANEDKLNIEVTLEDAKATYEINNNKNLENGSIITIKAVSSDKSITKEYKLNIQKDNNDDNTNEIIDDNKNENNNTKENKKTYLPYIIFGTGLILFVIAFIYYEKRKKIQG